MNQIGITSGITIALALGIPFGHPGTWRFVPLIAAALPFIQIITAPAMIESPVWLATRKELGDTATVTEDQSLLASQTDADGTSLPAHRHEAMKIGEVWSTSDPAVRSGLRTVITTQIAQQISGINAGRLRK
jgi:hypothetical protein